MLGGGDYLVVGKIFVVGEGEPLEVLPGCPFAVIEIPFLL